MKAVEAGNLQFFQFKNMAEYKELRHGVFTRQGGVSEPPYASLNISHGLGDNDRNVTDNRRLLLQSIGGDAIAFLRQVHGGRVIIVDDFNGALAGDVNGEPRAPRADAMISSCLGLTLGIQVADCQPILLFDPVMRIVANIHAGWRGSVADIAGQTVAAMAASYGCRTENMLAGIGPSLGPCCAEFKHYRSELPEKFWHYKDSKDRFDFWQISMDQLCDAGLLRKHIEIGGLCTRCNTDRFFSYRGEKQTGRCAAVIGLK